MRRFTIIFSALVITLIIAGFGPGSKLDGKWKGVAMGPQGDYDLVYTFNVQGDSLTGSVVVASMGDTAAITHGTVNGNNFSFDVDYNYTTYHHVCTLANDTVSMKIDGGEGILTAKLTRAESN